jgi:hypothetical protein
VTVVDALGGASGPVTFQIAVVNPVPVKQPAGTTSGAPSPLPGARPPGQGAAGGPPPNPLPPSR